MVEIHHCGISRRHGEEDARPLGRPANRYFNETTVRSSSPTHSGHSARTWSTSATFHLVSPGRNIESFNNRVRNECLNMNEFHAAYRMAVRYRRSALQPNRFKCSSKKQANIAPGTQPRRTSIGTCPAVSVNTIFGRVPLRIFVDSRSGCAWFFSCPRCSAISLFNAILVQRHPRSTPIPEQFW